MGAHVKLTFVDNAFSRGGTVDIAVGYVYEICQHLSVFQVPAMEGGPLPISSAPAVAGVESTSDLTTSINLVSTPYQKSTIQQGPYS